MVVSQLYHQIILFAEAPSNPLLNLFQESDVTSQRVAEY